MRLSAGNLTRRLVATRGPRPRKRVCGPCTTACAVVLAGVLSLAGCVSIQKFEEPPPLLRDAIRDGDFVMPGQYVSVVTTSRGELAFRVTEVDRNAIRGKEEEVPIDEIVALEKRRFDLVKTAGVTVGGYLGFVLLMGLAFAGVI